MDRSYPYSRRLVSRARLHKRITGVIAAALVGVTAVSTVAWNVDALSPAPDSAAPAQLVVADQATTAAPGPRRIYPYSVIPGGVSGHAELARVIRTDRVVAQHYAEFDVDKARALVVDKPRAVHVSYRKNGKIYWTAHKVMLAQGETLLSDGRNEMRARCANRISDKPQLPVEAHEPTMAELDNAVDLDATEQDALAAEGMLVSMDPDTGLPRQTGKRFALHGGAAGGAAGGGSADAALAASSFSPSALDLGSTRTLGLSGSSSSVGGRPRPVGGNTPESSDSSTSPDGSAANNSGSSAPSSGSTKPVLTPGAGTGSDAPVISPLPESNTATPPAEAPGARPDPVPVPVPSPSPQPGPLPTPTPSPGTDASPANPPLPTGEQNGGGSTEQPLLPLPPGTAPGADPVIPHPGTDAEPFNPKPDVTKPPPESGAGEAKPHNDVPEPGSFWLTGIAFAALLVLRRRPGRVRREC